MRSEATLPIYGYPKCYDAAQNVSCFKIRQIYLQKRFVFDLVHDHPYCMSESNQLQQKNRMVNYIQALLKKLTINLYPVPIKVDK